MMDGPGDQFFAGAAFARNENGCIALRDSFGKLDKLQHPRAGNDGGHA
jgi:hypothetical protein